MSEFEDRRIAKARQCSMIESNVAGRVRLECSCGQNWVIDIPRHVAQILAEEPAGLTPVDGGNDVSADRATVEEVPTMDVDE